MKPLYKGLTIAVVHLLIVSSLGAKLLIDRAARPRVWVRAASYDPDTPLRGRYASLQINVDIPPEKQAACEKILDQTKQHHVGEWIGNYPSGRLEVREGKLVVIDDPCCGEINYGSRLGPNGLQSVLSTPVAFYLPEHVPDPTIGKPGRELWVEVTIPRKGPPRPIRLGYKENGKLTPLDLR